MLRGKVHVPAGQVDGSVVETELGERGEGAFGHVVGEPGPEAPVEEQAFGRVVAFWRERRGVAVGETVLDGI